MTTRCSSQLLQQIKQLVMSLVLAQLKEQVYIHVVHTPLDHTNQYDMGIARWQMDICCKCLQNSTIVETFSKQLDATLHATLLKYLNKM